MNKIFRKNNLLQVIKISKNKIFFLKNIITSSLYKFKFCFTEVDVKFDRNVRINQKTYFTGKGEIELEKDVSVGYKLGGNFRTNVTEMQARYTSSKIIIRNNVSINNSNFILAANKIDIGSNCKIGANVTMMDFEAHGTKSTKRNQIGKVGHIKIGKNVWIGNNSIILKNVTIGDNSIIAAGSVVLKGIYPNNCIIGGNPAKFIKYI